MYVAHFHPQAAGLLSILSALPLFFHSQSMGLPGLPRRTNISRRTRRRRRRSPPMALEKRGTYEPYSSKTIRALIAVNRFCQSEVTRRLEYISVPTATNRLNNVWLNPANPHHLHSIHPRLPGQDTGTQSRALDRAQFSGSST